MSEVRKQKDDELLKIYITDALKLISENTAKYVGGNSFKKRYAELIDRKENEPKENATQVKTRLLNKFKKDFIDIGE